MTTLARVYLSPPDMSPRDRELLVDAFDSNWVAPLGPHVDAFEREFADAVGVEHAVAVSSGTAALHLSLITAGIKPGDRVITPTLTFVATANAIRHAGAIPVFVDCDRDTWTIDPTIVEQVAGELAAAGTPAAAVLPVDLFGQSADYHALRETCLRYRMALIADSAESLGATYRGKSAGADADFACFSFNGNKIITTSGGGMVVTSSAEKASRVRSLASQARSPGVDYHHEEVGYNYRMSNLLAAIGRGQLETLSRRVARRREIFRRYREELKDSPGITFMPEAGYGQATRWLSCMLVDTDKAGCTAEDLRLALQEDNIESRSVWKPLHLQPAHRSALAETRSTQNYSVAEDLWRRGLCLPSGSSLSDEDQERVIANLRRTLSASGRASAA